MTKRKQKLTREQKVERIPNQNLHAIPKRTTVGTTPHISPAYPT